MQNRKMIANYSRFTQKHKLKIINYKYGENKLVVFLKHDFAK